MKIGGNADGGCLSGLLGVQRVSKELLKLQLKWGVLGVNEAFLWRALGLAKQLSQKPVIHCYSLCFGSCNAVPLAEYTIHHIRTSKHTSDTHHTTTRTHSSLHL